MEAFGKERGPLAVSLLSFITLGVYFIYWHAKINQEIGNYDEKIEVSPGLSALAVLTGYVANVLLLAGVISVFNTAERAKRMVRDFDAPVNISAGWATLLYLLGGLGFPMLAIFYPFYMQRKLNRFWHHQVAKMRVEAVPPKAA